MNPCNKCAREECTKRSKTRTEACAFQIPYNAETKMKFENYDYVTSCMYQRLDNWQRKGGYNKWS